MSDIMRPVPFNKLLDIIFNEYAAHGSVFGVRREKFYKNESGTSAVIFGEKMASAIGPAAGPQSQLAQNIVAGYLTGGRFFELKTVQKIDGEELRACVAKPCINARDLCFNVEWSTELTISEAFEEYVKAWVIIQVLGEEWGLSAGPDAVFNMSVGYDLEGIKSPKIDAYIEGLKNAAETDVWKTCVQALNDYLPKLKKVDRAFVDGISPKVCSSITLSTLHGCPPQEIDRIARYLLTEKKLHTFIKCNPTLLGYETAREICDSMGYADMAFDDHHFKADLQYKDAAAMFKELMPLAKSLDLGFGVKITNTFPVQITRAELPGSEMYMSGRLLFPLSVTVAKRLSEDFNGKLPISYSGGADFFNIAALVECGIFPITVATTILKPGGYARFRQLAKVTEPGLFGAFKGIDVAKLTELADNATGNKRRRQDARHVASRKTESKLPLADCFKAPCKAGGCPTEQQIPQYISLVHAQKYAEAFQVIAIDNTAPAITGHLCNHACQTKCTRLDYDSSVEIRNMKRLAVLGAQDEAVKRGTAADLRTEKAVAVIGAGPAGIAAALFLRRNGVPATVFEKRGKPYGIVAHVIPEFRIAREMIEKDYRLAVAAGVKFIFNARPEYDVKAMQKDYAYVVLATGAWKEGDLGLKSGGRKTLDALKFLEASKMKGLNAALGKRVAVIGGGDVAMDCARAAKRIPGVENVTIVYRRTKAYMPAEREEIRLAEEDGVAFMELLAPVSYDGETLVCDKMALTEADASGRCGIKATNETASLKFDTVISAVGAKVDTKLFVENGVALDAKGRVIVNSANETSVAGVYAAGDCKAGASTIVKAIADGKAIAKDILAKLGLPDDFVTADVPQHIEALYGKKGILADPCKTEHEGERCLGCDTLCEICVDVCPNRANVAVKVDGFKNHKQIIHIDGMCNECGNCGTFCPHTGNPYKDKMTVFWSEEDFADSTNVGFLPFDENKFKIRDENGNVAVYGLDDTAMPETIRAFISAIKAEHPYYF